MGTLAIAFVIITTITPVTPMTALATTLNTSTAAATQVLAIFLVVDGDRMGR